MQSKEDLVNYIEETATNINRMFVELVSKKEVMGHVDAELRTDIEFILVGLRNSIEEFNQFHRNSASSTDINLVDTIASKLTSETPEILNPIE